MSAKNLFVIAFLMISFSRSSLQRDVPEIAEVKLNLYKTLMRQLNPQLAAYCSNQIFTDILDTSLHCVDELQNPKDLKDAFNRVCSCYAPTVPAAKSYCPKSTTGEEFNLSLDNQPCSSSKVTISFAFFVSMCTIIIAGSIFA